jgi:hypothetical protein
MAKTSSFKFQSFTVLEFQGKGKGEGQRHASASNFVTMKRMARQSRAIPYSSSSAP